MIDKNSIIQYQSNFDALAHTISDIESGEQVEFWYARDIQKLLGYARWENFLVAIKRAMESCNSLNINIVDHFRDVTKMVDKILDFLYNNKNINIE